MIYRSHEQYDFSAWLAKEENLSILGEDLGIVFTGIETEQFVGSYRCDIVAKDDYNEGKVVIIESQLESSNHDHLGKNNYLCIRIRCFKNYLDCCKCTFGT